MKLSNLAFAAVTVAATGAGIAACGGSPAPSNTPAATQAATPAATQAAASPGAFQSEDSSAPGGFDASNPGGYTDAQDCTTLSRDFATFDAAQNSQNLLSVQTDLTADGSGLTDSPALASAATAMGSDISSALEGNGKIPASASGDEAAVTAACAAAGVKMPPGFNG